MEHFSATSISVIVRYINRPGAYIIKLITAVIYSFHNKLECLSLNTRLGRKCLPGTNTLAYYGNRKLRNNKRYATGPWSLIPKAFFITYK